MHFKKINISAITKSRNEKKLLTENVKLLKGIKLLRNF